MNDFFKKSWLIIIFAFIFGIIFFNFANADLTSTNFKLENPINIIGGGQASSPSFQYFGSTGQLTNGQSTSISFVQNAGFLYFPTATSPIVQATAGNTQVALTWTAATGILANITSYELGVSTSSGGTYTYTSVDNVLSSTKTSLTNGTPYYFRVRSYAAGILLSESAVVSATPSGGANISLGSVIEGQAELPAGATSVVLANTTVLDLSTGLSGDAVILQSGVDGQPVVLTNLNLAGVSASIPDGTKIQGPAGWDGKITPPVAGTPSGGNAPEGFSVGSTVISIGSPDGALFFNNPVTILLTSVTGTVGYRPSGSNTWMQITNACGGTYATPTPPTSPGECAISNGTDTKIVTYHFTSFGSLIPVSSGGGGGGNGGGGNGGGGGGGGGGNPPTTLNTVTFSGRAYPNSTIVLLKDAQVFISTVAGGDANFTINANNLSAGNYVFSVYSEDNQGNRSSLLTFPVSLTTNASTNIGGIFLAPTISVDKTQVKKGDNITFFGQSTPNSEVTISINSVQEIFHKINSDNNGVYLHVVDSSALDLGDHTAKSKAATDGQISSYSKVVAFTVGETNLALEKTVITPLKSDLNNDGKVNLIDFSIMAFWYNKPNPPAKIDLNGDGKINLVDFSIMAYYWTG